MYEVQFVDNRVLLIRAATVHTLSEFAEVRASIRDALERATGTVVTVVDIRSFNVLMPEIAQGVIEMLRADNPKVERSAFLIRDGAVIAMQVDRLAREGGNPNRRAFRSPESLEPFLGEVLTAMQLATVRRFLAAPATTPTPSGMRDAKVSAATVPATPSAAAPRTPPTSQRTTSIAPGALLAGRYRIRAPIGKGGMGEVFSGDDERLARKVAIKVLPMPLAADTAIRERFEREAQLMAKLRHPNVVDVFDVFEEGDVPCFVMRFIQGSTLAATLAVRKKLPAGEAIALVAQACDALAHIHAAGLVHRDVKSANMIVEPSGNLVLLDFGIAKGPDSTGATAVGQAIGTPRYMSPEQARGDAVVDRRSDLYSLGVVLYELVTGTAPFNAGSSAELFARVLYEAPKPAHEIEPRVSPALSSALERALAKDPAARFPSADAMKAALTTL